MSAPARGAMPKMPADDNGSLNTALIFEDTVYVREALNLPSKQTEEELEAELALLAQESGIQDPYLSLSSPQDISRAVSTVTLDIDSDDRSSSSIHSQETQSTSFTSAPSRTSRDQVPNDRPAAQRKPTLARPSLSIDNQSQARTVDSPSPGIEQRRSTSAVSVAQSVLSESSSISSSISRRKRGLDLFGMFRRDSRYADTRVPRRTALIACVAHALPGRTMDIIAKVEASNLNVAIRCQRMQPVCTSRKQRKGKNMQYPAAAVSLCHGKSWIRY